MYNINQVAMMTGFSTRSIRTYIHQGFLEGEKIDGVWQFSEEDISRFFAHSAVKPGILAKRNGQVYDFMADRKKTRNELCVILDLTVSNEEAAEASAFFCNAISGVKDVKFSYHLDNGNARITLTGAEDAVKDLMAAYYRA